MKYISILIVLFFSLQVNFLFAQEEENTLGEREVDIVTKYKPIISDVNKITTQPKVKHQQ